MTIRFADFKRLYGKDIVPNIMCGIRTDMELTEALSVDHYDDFIGPEHLHPLNNGFVRLYKGVYKHSSGKFYFFPGDKEPRVFSDEDDAVSSMYDENTKRLRAVSKLDIDLSRHFSTKKFSNTDIDAIKAYTHYNSRVNHRIFNNNSDPEHLELVKNIDRAVSREHAPDDLVVYSGTNSDHTNLINSQHIVNHPSFMSTSLNIHTAGGFARDKGGDVLKIHVPAGHPGVYVGHISHLPFEREFILPRNTKLQIDHSKRQVLSDDLAKKTIYIHHAHILED